MQRENFPLQGIDFLFSWSRCKYQLPTILVCKLFTYYTNKCKNIIFPKNCLSLPKYVVYLCFLEPPSETTNYYMYVYHSLPESGSGKQNIRHSQKIYFFWKLFIYRIIIAIHNGASWVLPTSVFFKLL